MKRQLVAALAVISIVLCASGTVIYAMPESSVVNHFRTGIVDIDLKEYMLLENGKETEWSDSGNVFPGMKISKIPRIINNGNDCYVRVKITFGDMDVLNEANIFGMDDSWIKAEDGYYYYKNILMNKDSVDVFRGITVPEALSREKLEGQISLEIDADAVQADNFTPDFESSDPWRSTEILKNEKNNDYEDILSSEKENVSLQIEYQGEAGKLIVNPEDFFSNFPVLLPGDSYSDRAVIENSGSNEAKIYFKNEILKEDEILDKIRLTVSFIQNERETLVYEGSLKGEELVQSICLGTIPPGEKGELCFKIDVPESLDNAYSKITSCVKWIFSTEEIIPPVVEQIDEEIPAESVSAPQTAVPAAKTGDTDWLPLAMIGCGISAGVAAVVLEKMNHDSIRGKVKKRRRGNENI